MDSIVQLVRNALCVCKDLELLRATLLWDSSIVTEMYDLPHPFNKTTPLEICISLAQAYVIYSGVPAGCSMVVSNYCKLQRIQRLMAKYGQTVSNDADRIINSSLLHEATLSLKHMFVGFNIFFIACSFLWLAGNSWHVTETTMIGGVQALFHALTVMNACLLPMLYYMYTDGTGFLIRTNTMRTVKKRLQQQLQNLRGMEGEDKNNSKGPMSLVWHPSEITLPIFEILSQSTSWKPFYSNPVGFFDSIDETLEEKAMALEKLRVRSVFDTFCNSNTSTNTTTTTSTNNTAADTSRNMTIIEERIHELECKIPVLTMEGYREYLYLVLNFIAFYGYSVCIVVYYYPNEALQPLWMRYGILFNATNSSADFYGNLAGDVMWTIEPMIALASPYYIRSITKQQQKQLSPVDEATYSSGKAKIE